jgi:hypothetical protein
MHTSEQFQKFHVNETIAIATPIEGHAVAQAGTAEI